MMKKRYGTGDVGGNGSTIVLGKQDWNLCPSIGKECRLLLWKKRWWWRRFGFGDVTWGWPTCTYVEKWAAGEETEVT